MSEPNQQVAVWGDQVTGRCDRLARAPVPAPRSRIGGAVTNAWAWRRHLVHAGGAFSQARVATDVSASPEYLVAAHIGWR
jgi:hypothetical protein